MEWTTWQRGRLLIGQYDGLPLIMASLVIAVFECLSIANTGDLY